VTLSDDPAERMRLLALLLPQALPHSIPVALMIGLSVAIGSRRLSIHVTAVVLALALCGSVVSFGAMGWGAPLANQEFRTRLAGYVQPKGSAELTLGELRSRRAVLTAILRESPVPQFARKEFERTDLRYHPAMRHPRRRLLRSCFCSREPDRTAACGSHPRARLPAPSTSGCSWPAMSARAMAGCTESPPPGCRMSCSSPRRLRFFSEADIVSSVSNSGIVLVQLRGAL
jgi:hypothetical protein